MTTLVTGAGLIGTLTAGLLAARGEPVVLCDVRPPAELPEGADFTLCDVTDRAALSSVIRTEGIDRIVHCAAILSTGCAPTP